MIFQALGSGNNFSQSIQHLFSYGSAKNSLELKSTLEKRYGGSVQLYAKGRFALSAAVQATQSKAVAINGFTCSVVVDAVQHANASTVYVDIAEGAYHYSAEELDAVLEKNDTIKAVVIQNTFGILCDIVAIEAVAKKHGCYIIEDLAHSIGQTYADGRETGTVGDLVMLTFGRDKMIDVVNGGALVIRNPQLTSTEPDQQVGLIDNARDRWYPLLTWFVRATYPIGIGKVLLALMYRLRLAVRSADGIIDTRLGLSHWKARLVLKKLRLLDKTISSRQKNTEMYAAHIQQPIIPDATIRTVLHVNDQKKILLAFRKHGFMLDDTWYDTPIGPRRKYKSYDYPETTHPHAVAASRHTINLPTHQYVSPKSVVAIAKIIKDHA